MDLQLIILAVEMSKITTRFIYTYYDPTGALQFVEKIIDFNDLDFNDVSNISVRCSVFEPYKFTRFKTLQSSSKISKNKVLVLIKKYKFEFSMKNNDTMLITVYKITGDGDWEKEYEFEKVFPYGLADCSVYTLTDTEFELP